MPFIHRASLIKENFNYYQNYSTYIKNKREVHYRGYFDKKNYFDVKLSK